MNWISAANQAGSIASLNHDRKNKQKYYHSGGYDEQNKVNNG